jgi:hypothetical protein
MGGINPLQVKTNPLGKRINRTRSIDRPVPRGVRGRATVQGLYVFMASNFQCYNHLIHQFLVSKSYFLIAGALMNIPSSIFFIASAFLNNSSNILYLLYTYSSLHLLIEIKI